MNSASLLTRRQLLQAGMIAVAGSTAQRALADKSPTDKVKKPGWIDAHSHIWTRDVKSFPLANGKTVADLKPPSFTAEELIKISQPEGVSRVVLIQHHTYHGWDNSYLIDAARRYPGRFRVTGMVDDAKPHPDVTMKKLLKQQVTGFRITSWIRGKDKWLDGPGMAAMWKCAAETGQAMCCLIDPADLEPVDKM